MLLSKHQTALTLGLTSAILLIFIIFHKNLPQEYWLYYFIINLTTFAWYGYDKHQAKHQGWRTPELRLHLLALFGGFSGAFLAQRMFFHKLNKVNFTLISLSSALLHACALYFV